MEKKPPGKGENGIKNQQTEIVKAEETFHPPEIFFRGVKLLEAYLAKTLFRWTNRGRPSSLTMSVSPWMRGRQ